MMFAVKTFPARRRIGHDHAISDAPFRTLDLGLWTLDFGNDSRQLVSKDRGRHDHLRVITAFEDFQVSAAGQGRFDSDAHLARLERLRLSFFDANIFFSVKNSGFHSGLLD